MIAVDFGANELFDAVESPFDLIGVDGGVVDDAVVVCFGLYLDYVTFVWRAPQIQRWTSIS